MRWILAVACAATLVCGAVQARADDAYAPTSLTASQILSKANAARGELRSGAYHRVSQTSGNGTVSTADTYEDDDGYVTTVHNGAFTTAFGSNSEAGWTQDVNGTVVVESGFHERDDPYAAAIRDASHDDSGVHVLGVTTSQPACVVVQLTPRKGLTQKRFYDASTFLLRRVVTTGYDGQTSTYTFSNFAKKYGETYPQTIAYADAAPENARTTHVTLLQRVSRSAFSLATPKSTHAFDLQQRPKVQIPAEFSPHGIIVRVTVAGRGLDFELDSGASRSVIDSGVARQLGLSLYDVRKESFSGEFTSALTRIPDLSLGDLHVKNFAIDAIAFDQTVGDRKVVGLLGGDFFASGRVEIDFKDHTVWLEAPSSDPMPAPWVALPIQVDDLVPRTQAAFNGVKGSFIVDLGSDLTLLYGHYFAHFHPDKVGDVMGEVEGISGKAVDFHQYTFSRLDLGSMAFADVQTTVAMGKAFEGRDYDGLLGRDVLSNFNLVFDYADQKLYVDSLLPP